MPTQDKRKSPDTEQEGKNLNKLLQLINVPASKQQLPSISHKQCQVENLSQWPLPQPSTGSTQSQSSESRALEKFSCKYKNERNFSRHPQHKLFLEIFSSLVRQRLCCVDWVDRAPPESILRLITCLRILMRDPSYQKKFTELGGLQVLSDDFKKATDSYLRYRDNPYVVDILKEMTNIFQKLSHVKEQRELLIACNAHTSLVLLLSARDVIVLHCSLHALIQLTESERPRQIIGEMNAIESLLNIIQEYDSLSKKLAAKLLQCLCHDSESRETIQQYDGVPILLSQLQSDNVNLLKHVIWCLVQLCEDHNASKEIRHFGGIPLILSLLQPDREFVTERSENSEGVASAGPHGRTPVVDEAEELMEQEYSLKSACCAALTELVMNDANAQQIAQANGIYSLGLLILPADRKCSEKERKLVKNLQRNAFRALRFLFSMERNRRLFKSLFPPDLFEMFINIGHYNRDLKKYKSLVEEINSLSSEAVREIKMNIMETNQNKAATRYIGEFEVFELLGKGAFGSVYKVKKKTTFQSFLALKEVNIDNPAFGKNSRERDQSVGDIMNELSIIREQMKHPNVVKYYKTFVDDERLYIVMELIEGAPLAEHFSSLKEKKETFPESRVWDILMQLVLALRYLHKEKGIVHRDLTPNNIMLGENDKIVQNLPYGEKADIWALGCIIYQMCTLQPPFFSNNMLTLVTKIVEAKYDSITSDEYTPRLKEVYMSITRQEARYTGTGQSDDR
ncbi:hypothetical protein KUTeg_008340 [Tegillarca granosa]|uniref:Protein kinase domain-containing protein n=1 Tax=Tegillarca granosa TaxID=220873 RepID=A0ABQ9F8X1_TEGGR|nr:hypothetical protein KUTeg_008340 [Tegillarca granosa]